MLRYLAAAARRFAKLVTGVAAVTAVLSILAALVSGTGIHRAVSLGFYLVGCFLLVAGFFIGNRGPTRIKGAGGVPLLGARFVRWATPSEREETLNDSAIFVAIGLTLILLGAAVDDRHRLF